MRRPFFITLLGAILLSGAARLNAQELELPEYTEEERWERLGELTVGWQAALVALGEAKGMTAEETGKWVGKFFSRSWLSGGEASWYFRWAYGRNFMAMPGASVEVLATTPTSVTGRVNRPEDAALGPGNRLMGVPGKKINAMLNAIDATVADWVGVGLERESDGEYDILTLETQYGPIRADDDIRWARNSYLSWLTWLQYMSLRMESGMTAEEIGVADAELYGPGWGARTPWALFRGMTWNLMSDPNADCEVLSASPDEVRARCLEHYRDLVIQNEERFGVTPEDVFESGRAFAMGVADLLGMQWAEVLEDGYRVITVTRQ
jgi:hypothetical protein